jgi:hypothetical protein
MGHLLEPERDEHQVGGKGHQEASEERTIWVKGKFLSCPALTGVGWGAFVKDSKVWEEAEVSSA